MNKPRDEKNPEAVRTILREIFNQASMDDLPAMSSHVQELIYLTNSSRATAAEITEAILKDYSLTNKILQVANSAHYNRGVPINNISRAVTVIGYSTVRELATAIALFEEFLATNSDKDELSKLLTMSFLAGMQIKIIAAARRIPFPVEDAFICGLLYNLGRVAVLIFLPNRYKAIMKLMQEGKDEDEAARLVLEDLTLHDVGRELARFWNFSDHIIATMDPHPPHPKGPTDGSAFLHNLVVFCNDLITSICRDQQFQPLYDRYARLFALDRPAALSSLEKSIEASEDTSPAIRNGLELLQVRRCIQTARKQA